MPTLTDTELLQYCPPNPAGVAVIGDVMIVPDHYTDAFAVFDTSTGVSKKFTGVGASPVPRNVIVSGGYAWTTARSGTTGYLRRIGTDGGVAGWTFPSAVHPSYVSFLGESGGSNIFSIYQKAYSGYADLGRFDYSTDTWALSTSVLAGLSNAVGSGGVIYAIGHKKRWDASTGAAMSDLSSATLGSGRGTDTLRTLVHNGVLWATDTSTSTVSRWDLAANTALTGLSLGFGTGQPTLGPNNIVYVPGIAAPYTDLAVIETGSLALAKWSFSTGRQKRNIVLPGSDGKMYAFAGETPV